MSYRKFYGIDVAADKEVENLRLKENLSSPSDLLGNIWFDGHHLYYLSRLSDTNNIETKFQQFPTLDYLRNLGVNKNGVLSFNEWVPLGNLFDCILTGSNVESDTGRWILDQTLTYTWGIGSQGRNIPDKIRIKYYTRSGSPTEIRTRIQDTESNYLVNEWISVSEDEGILEFDINQSYSLDISEVQVWIPNGDIYTAFIDVDFHFSTFGINYINNSETIVDGLIDLDSQLKFVSDKSKDVCVYDSRDHTTQSTYTITHNLNSEYIDAQIWVDNGTGFYENASISMTMNNPNRITVDIGASKDIIAIISKVDYKIAEINSSIYTETTSTPNTTHTITHNLQTYFPSIMVWVNDAGTWKNDSTPVQIVDQNQIQVDLAVSANIRIIVSDFDNRTYQTQTTTASTTHTFLHNLNTSFPDVTVWVWDSINSVWKNDFADIQIDNNNQITVGLASAENIRVIVNALTNKTYTIETTTPSTSHTILHNLDTDFSDVKVWVWDSTNSVWKNDSVDVQIDNSNQITVNLSISENIKAIITDCSDITLT